MVKKITFALLTRWEKRWERIKKILKLDDEELIRRVKCPQWAQNERCEAHNSIKFQFYFVLQIYKARL